MTTAPDGLDHSVADALCRAAAERRPVIVTRGGRAELVTLTYWPGTRRGTRKGGAKPKVRDRAGRTYSVPIDAVRLIPPSLP